MNYPNDYAYIESAYGIKPVYGERVRTEGGKMATVKRERPSHGHYVCILIDGDKYPAFAHPQSLTFGVREGQAND